MTREEFKELVKNGPVILDGATGSNLQNAGMPVGVCPEQWILEHPQTMIDLQRAYVEAGTQILLAPTFTANRIKLEEYGLADKLVEMNQQLVAISKEAAGGKAKGQCCQAPESSSKKCGYGIFLYLWMDWSGR